MVGESVDDGRSDDRSPKTSPQRPKGLLEVMITLAHSWRDETRWKNRLAPSASKGM